MKAPVILGTLLAAQIIGLSQTAESKITFEVASVKPAGPFVPGNSGGRRGGPGTGDPGRVTFPRATLVDLLTQAYDVRPDQVSGPDWLSDRGRYVYTVTATMPPDTTMDQYRVMLQNLLAERFHVRLHHETQSRPGYELVVAEGGPKLKEWTPETSRAPSGPGTGANGFPRRSSSSGQGVTLTIPMSGRPAPIWMTYRESMAAFCRGLGSEINMSNGVTIGSPQPRVVDKTGLPGIYEFTFEFAGTMLVPGVVLSPPAEGNSGVPVASDPPGVPNLFSALPQQLGLKLRKVKDVPIDVLIIDNADRVPSEN